MMNFIDEIYEAAVVPEKWRSVLRDLTKVGKGAFTSLIVLRGDQMRFVGTPEAEQLIAEYQAITARKTAERCREFL